MTWNTCYLPPDPNHWQGRHDTPPLSHFFQIMQLLNLLEIKSITVTKPTFALVGFRCDEGIRRNQGRTGAFEGPMVIRQSLSQLPIQHHRFECYDAGNIACIDGNLEASQEALGEIITLLLRLDVIPIIMGGGHELSYGHYLGIANAFPAKQVGLTNFDARFDMKPMLRHQLGTSESAFLQIAELHRKTARRFDYNCIGTQHTGNIRQLVDTAKKYDTKIIWADELHLGQHEKCGDFIDRIIDQNDIIYLSTSLDVFAAAFAPGVSSPEPFGLLPWHILPLIRQLAASGKVISYDIAEMSPRYDVDNRTAKLAAMLIYEFIHHHNESPRTW